MRLRSTSKGPATLAGIVITAVPVSPSKSLHLCGPRKTVSTNVSLDTSTVATVDRCLSVSGNSCRQLWVDSGTASQGLRGCCRRYTWQRTLIPFVQACNPNNPHHRSDFLWYSLSSEVRSDGNSRRYLGEVQTKTFFAPFCNRGETRTTMMENGARHSPQLSISPILMRPFLSRW